MIRTLQNLPFEVESPSYLRLARSLTGAHVLDVAYIDNREWMLTHEAPEGDVTCCFFDSRDAAIGGIVNLLRSGVPA